MRAKQLVIDFSGPNVAKPMHVGHIRSTILGDALARIAEFIGHRVVRDNHNRRLGHAVRDAAASAGRRSSNKEALATDPLGEMERIYKLIQSSIKRETLAALKSRFPDEFARLEVAGFTGDEIIGKLLSCGSGTDGGRESKGAR